ncbi:MAG TPA: hypothetical protein VJH68_03840 [Candidatus Nanoarchaeia archaeon]|nr:hypothetical protein [Candidatus Nanoarchaeia archaeon]
MKIYRQKWWKKLFPPAARKKINSGKNIQAVLEFLQEIKADAGILSNDLKQLSELEQERQVASSGIAHININTQAALLEKIIERFEFLESDAAINGIRVKHIAETLLEEARRRGMADLAAQKQKKWRLDW